MVRPMMHQKPCPLLCFLLCLSLTVAGMVSAAAGVAMAQSPSTYKPTKRGGGGPLKVLWWQGPTLLNPHFAVGTKDQDGSRLFYEPLAAWDNDGNLQPKLAAVIPTKENGGIAADGTWRLDMIPSSAVNADLCTPQSLRFCPPCPLRPMLPPDWAKTRATRRTV